VSSTSLTSSAHGRYDNASKGILEVDVKIAALLERRRVEDVDILDTIIETQGLLQKTVLLLPRLLCRTETDTSVADLGALRVGQPGQGLRRETKFQEVGESYGVAEQQRERQWRREGLFSSQ
jgi:hypothetical protein